MTPTDPIRDLETQALDAMETGLWRTAEELFAVAADGFEMEGQDYRAEQMREQAQRMRALLWLEETYGTSPHGRFEQVQNLWWWDVTPVRPARTPRADWLAGVRDFELPGPGVFDARYFYAPKYNWAAPGGRDMVVEVGRAVRVVPAARYISPRDALMRRRARRDLSRGSWNTDR